MHAPKVWPFAISGRSHSTAAPEQLQSAVRCRLASAPASDSSYDYTARNPPPFMTLSGSPVHLGQLSPSSSASSTSPSIRRSSGPVTEDDALRSIARHAMKRINSISTNAFVKGTWKQRRSQANELMLEHRSPCEYRIITQSMVPCTMDEISDVLSTSSSAHFNASLIELLGSDFSYGLTVRSVPTTRSQSVTTKTSLTLKALSFGGDSLVSTRVDAEGNYLDYMERDTSMRTERRALQQITRKRGPDGQIQIVAGNSLCGYALHEDQETQQTVILLYGTYEGTSAPEDRAVRHAAIHRLRKLAQFSTKWVQIALRRRLGSQTILDPTTDASRSLLELSCVGCDGDFHTFYRKRHFCHLCGLHACASCSSVEGVEQELGKIRRLRVCHGCVQDVGSELFSRQVPGKERLGMKRVSFRTAEVTRPKIRLL